MVVVRFDGDSGPLLRFPGGLVSAFGNGAFRESDLARDLAALAERL